jgi:hypothetical protein
MDRVSGTRTLEAVECVLFQPVGWEDILGGVGRPQKMINEDVKSSDYFIFSFTFLTAKQSPATPKGARKTIERCPLV